MENELGSAVTTNQHVQHGQEEDVAAARQTAPQPPPFNPLLSHGGLGQSLGHSVVPDLMKVYESLTQSKTPDHPGIHAPSQYQQHPYQAPPQPIYQYNQTNNQYQVPAPGSHTQGQHYGHGPQQPQPMNYMSSEQQFGQSDYAETAKAASTGRSLRKRSMDKVEDDRSSSEGSTSKRKKGKSDGRWAKRFTWPDDLHRDFVSAIFDVGLKHASPSTILEYMPQHDEITSERIKSHLQKYRMHRSKSKEEFMTCYETSLNTYQTSGVNGRSLSSGEVAAHLTYSTIQAEAGEEQTQTQEQLQGSPDSPQAAVASLRSGALMLPKLTEAEKQSPIGASLGYLMGLFFSLRQQLMASRAAAGTQEGDASNQRSMQSPPMTVAPHLLFPSTSDADQVQDHDPAPWVPPSAPPIGGAQQQPSYQELPQDPVNAGAKGAASAASHASTRTNIEESHLMKREMQSQMAFQNKMRALKQQELNKYKSSASDNDHQGQGGTEDDAGDGHSAPQTYDHSRIKGDEEAAKGIAEDHDARYQGAGEAAETVNNLGIAAKRSRHLSMGGEDFWVNDEQLFEFLMNS